MSITPLDRIVRYLDEEHRSRYAESIEDLISNGATPIEAVLFMAINARFLIDDYFRVRLREADNTNICGIEPQKKVEKFVVDYVISVLDEKSGRRYYLAVECDGHDFHERTKEQAKKDRSRDRRLQELGFTVYRFTGSEIHNDPIKCAEAILDWCYAKSWVRL